MNMMHFMSGTNIVMVLHLHKGTVFINLADNDVTT
jgi:hypothetical protein